MKLTVLKNCVVKVSINPVDLVIPRCSGLGILPYNTVHSNTPLQGSPILGLHSEITKVRAGEC